MSTTFREAYQILIEQLQYDCMKHELADDVDVYVKSTINGMTTFELLQKLKAIADYKDAEDYMFDRELISTALDAAIMEVEGRKSDD